MTAKHEKSYVRRRGEQQQPQAASSSLSSRHSTFSSRTRQVSPSNDANANDGASVASMNMNADNCDHASTSAYTRPWRTLQQVVHSQGRGRCRCGGGHLLPLMLGLLLLLMVLCISLDSATLVSLWKTAPSALFASRHRPRLVVALSTIPSRIHLLQPTLESLIHQQTLKPDLVYLTLPQKKADTNALLNYTLPDFVRAFQKARQLQVLTPEFDYGSIMKVLHVLEIESKSSSSTTPSSTSFSHDDTQIVYVDDDWIYHANMLQVLSQKSLFQYPNDALCLNGGRLRNYFRQVSHTHLENNRHPYIFMEASGTNTMLLSSLDGNDNNDDNHGKDHPVDIAQGFCGVLVKPKFFNMTALQGLLSLMNKQSTSQSSQSKSSHSTSTTVLPMGVVKSDDFILSAHLEYRNVTRRLVNDASIVPPTLTPAANIDKLSLYMYRHAMEAAYFLQDYWNIWQNYSFLDPKAFTKEEWDAIDCEAGRGRTNCDDWQGVLRKLDKKYPPK